MNSRGLRIIAGRWKGRRLDSPTWTGLRPTSDRLRGTLFNVLASRVVGARVLDGCAGTGAVGLEALSRGAAHVTFVERDRRAAALIEANAARCGGGGGYTIECRDVIAVLQRHGPGEAFDVILLDPPYDATNGREMLEAAERCLAPGGRIVLERASRRPLDVPASLARLRDVRSGDSTLTFLSRETGASPPSERQ
jgi:16S rRNA (guanine966-N2)-methyltransferase